VIRPITNPLSTTGGVVGLMAISPRKAHREDRGLSKITFNGSARVFERRGRCLEGRS